MRRLELLTGGLQNRCSTTELHRHLATIYPTLQFLSTPFKSQIHHIRRYWTISPEIAHFSNNHMSLSLTEDKNISHRIVFRRSTKPAFFHLSQVQQNKRIIVNEHDCAKISLKSIVSTTKGMRQCYKCKELQGLSGYLSASIQKGWNSSVLSARVALLRSHISKQR